VHADSLVPWKAVRVHSSGVGDHWRTTDAEEGLSLCMLFLVFVRVGRKVHGLHVIDSERTLAASAQGSGCWDGSCVCVTRSVERMTMS
jgi:hypothetical protein